MKKLIFTLLCIFSLFNLTGCEKAASKNDLVGMWKGSRNNEEWLTLNLKSDKTCYYFHEVSHNGNYKYSELNGTWQLSGNTLKIQGVQIHIDEGHPSNNNIENTHHTLTYENGGLVYVPGLVLKKQ